MIMHLTYNRQKLLELLEDQEKDWEGRKEGNRARGRRLMNDGRCPAGRIVQNE